MSSVRLSRAVCFAASDTTGWREAAPQPTGQWQGYQQTNGSDTYQRSYTGTAAGSSPVLPSPNTCFLFLPAISSLPSGIRVAPARSTLQTYSSHLQLLAGCERFRHSFQTAIVKFREPVHRATWEATCRLGVGMSTIADPPNASSAFQFFFVISDCKPNVFVKSRDCESLVFVGKTPSST
eukprot:6203833-Pleurochrysis_carterae.AAC.2